ncbi:hypothetical protein GCM10010420_44130 [Streptomyces glaucosporus]|uniref:PBS lyase n=1 Tax=Streptomyces glaucosporus TaxID=284044 RepID=A0ABP5VVN1_9ACTN
MLARLRETDWSALECVDGPADGVPGLLLGLASGDPEERAAALDGLRRAVRHQGDVHDSTIACVPFLFELVADPAVGDRGELVGLLVDIGDEDPYDEDDAAEDWDDEGTRAWRAMLREAATAVRAGADVLLSLVDDPDPGVRREAPFALALFHGDGARVLSVLGERLALERDARARLALVDAVEAVVRRHPGSAGDALMLLDGLFRRGTDPVERLAALSRLLSHAPERLPAGVVPTVAGLLDRVREQPPAGDASAGPAKEREAVEHAELVATETVFLLRVLHDLLGDRVAERTELVLHQLRGRDRSERVNALWAASRLVREWRGAHEEVVESVGRELADPELRGAAASVLRQFCERAAPAADHLAAAVAAEPGGGVVVRPSGTASVGDALTALARLGDPRAVPHLAAVLERPRLPDGLGGAMGSLGDRAAPLVPLLRRRLAETPPGEAAYAPALTSLLAWSAALGSADVLPEVLRVLRGSRGMPGERGAGIRRAALRAVEALGPAAQGAAPDLRALLSEPGTAVDAAAALWAAEGDAEAVLPALRAALGGEDDRARRSAASVLGRIGPAAAEAGPRLRELALCGGEPRARAGAAIALWRTAGDGEAVLPVLCREWERDLGTRGPIAGCLAEMGAAAGAAVPLLRAELAEARRLDHRRDADGGRGAHGVDGDEALLRACRRALGAISPAKERS